jgi:hypothetical protein
MKPEDPSTDDTATGLPWPRTWRGVYVFVFLFFVGGVIALTWFARSHA